MNGFIGLAGQLVTLLHIETGFIGRTGCLDRIARHFLYRMAHLGDGGRDLIQL